MPATTATPAPTAASLRAFSAASSESAPARTIANAPRRRYHFGSAGFIYIVITLLLALGAFNSQNNLLFWAFGFSLAILIVSGVLSGAMLMGIDVRRERIDDAEAGDDLRIRFRITNRNRVIPAFALSIEELPALTGEHAESTAAPKRRPAAHSTTSRIEQPRAFVAHIGPRERLSADAVVRALRRGPVRFRGYVVHSSFPFGLIRKSLVFSEPAGAVIRPARITTDLTLIERAISSGDADRPGRTRGQGDEFHSLREYVPGDNPGSIAWKPSARRGVLLVRQSLAPAPRRLWIILRLRVDPQNSDVLDEQAIRLAAAVARKARDSDLAVGLSVPLVRLHVAPRPQPGHIDRILHELGMLELGEPGAGGLAEPFPRLSGGAAGGAVGNRAGHGRADRDLCVCIHAGAIDTAFGPGGAGGGLGAASGVIHLSAASEPRAGGGGAGGVRP